MHAESDCTLRATARLPAYRPRSPVSRQIRCPTAMAPTPTCAVEVHAHLTLPISIFSSPHSTCRGLPLQGDMPEIRCTCWQRKTSRALAVVIRHMMTMVVYWAARLEEFVSECFVTAPLDPCSQPVSSIAQTDTVVRQTRAR